MANTDVIVPWALQIHTQTASASYAMHCDAA